MALVYHPFANIAVMRNRVDAARYARAVAVVPITVDQPADFALLARSLSRAAMRVGLVAPGFRCPPRVDGATRTIRRRQHGGVVAVQVHERSVLAVAADMIDGVIAINQLSGVDAARTRTSLWDALAYDLGLTTPTESQLHVA